ncbi:Hypp5239 [Branchiostoma lanceolatum]|uniref:Hypp5239 protein n=1 Tax=Branchiostoma lanceolatum TaxID=7740 RepID=A0A8K0AHD2_BRALA|nr:Hypp5239 [Branchiostoma lanceolatum]
MGFRAYVLLFGVMFALAWKAEAYWSVASAACGGQIGNKGYFWAIRRNCSPNGDGMTCAQVCKANEQRLLGYTSHRRPYVYCYDAFYVSYRAMYHYNTGCTWQANHCGPNYCCCRTPY